MSVVIKIRWSGRKNHHFAPHPVQNFPSTERATPQLEQNPPAAGATAGIDPGAEVTRAGGEVIDVVAWGVGEATVVVAWGTPKTAGC